MTLEDAHFLCNRLGNGRSRPRTQLEVGERLTARSGGTKTFSQQDISREYAQGLRRAANHEPGDPGGSEGRDGRGRDKVGAHAQLDKDLLDCGIFSCVKHYIRRFGWRVKTPRDMSRRWEQAWAMCVTSRLVNHAWERAGLPQ